MTLDICEVSWYKREKEIDHESDDGRELTEGVRVPSEHHLISHCLLGHTTISASLR